MVSKKLKNSGLTSETAKDTVLAFLKSRECQGMIMVSKIPLSRQNMIS